MWSIGIFLNSNLQNLLLFFRNLHKQRDGRDYILKDFYKRNYDKYNSKRMATVFLIILTYNKDYFKIFWKFSCAKIHFSVWCWGRFSRWRCQSFVEVYVFSYEIWMFSCLRFFCMEIGSSLNRIFSKLVCIIVDIVWRRIAF